MDYINTYIKNDFGKVRERFLKETGFPTYDVKTLTFPFLVADDLGDGARIYGERKKPRNMRDAEPSLLAAMSQDVIFLSIERRIEMLQKYVMVNVNIINNSRGAIDLCHPKMVNAIARYTEDIKNAEDTIEKINVIIERLSCTK